MTGSLFTSVAWFVLVIALIPLVLWLMKRMQVSAASAGRPGTPKLVAMLPISAQNKVVTVEVGHGEERVWLVLGSGPQGLRTLHTMSAQDDADSGLPQPPTAAFAQLLGRMKSQKDGGADRAF
jgi:flagellar protein FliO/FliZ